MFQLYCIEGSNLPLAKLVKIMYASPDITEIDTGKSQSLLKFRSYGSYNKVFLTVV